MRKLTFLLIMLILAVVLSGCFSPVGDTSPTLTSPPILTTPNPLEPTGLIPTANVNATFIPASNASGNFVPTAVITLDAPTFAPTAIIPLPTIQVVLPALGANSADTTTNSTTNNAAVTCTPPAGWFPYTVQIGDTIGSISVAADTAITDISAANCLTDADVINAGQVIYVPIPVSSAAVSATATPIAVALNNAGTTGNTTTINGSTNSVSIQNLWVEPAFVQGGEYSVTNGSTVTFRLGGLVAAQSVTFMLATAGSNSTPITLGVDNNLTDGVAVEWQVTTAGLQARVWAVVTDTLGGKVESIPIVVVTR